MKQVKTLLLLLLATGSIIAQEEHNLVPNSSFEELDGKIKEEGGVFLTHPWESFTMNPVDIYSEDAKSDDFSVPNNKYGEEKARTGKNYAGVSFFGYRGKMPRTYLGTQLTKPLEAGKEYCLKFHISMSDMSKYAVNNIGMYISEENISESSDANLYVEPQIISITNRVYDKQYSWEAVCGTYVAQGGEKYIVIGNFARDEDTKQEVVRLSKGFSGRQTYDAYYFVDDVSVIPTDKIGDKDCACEKIAGGQMKVQYKTFTTDQSLKSKAQKTTIKSSETAVMDDSELEKEVEEIEEQATEEKDGVVYKKFNSGASTTANTKKEVKKEKPKPYTPAEEVIFYESKKYQLPSTAKPALEKIATYLEKNPKAKLTIEGHADASESEVKFIGKRRGFMIQKELISLGVAKERISYEGKETSETLSKTDPSKNRRVTFSIQ